MLAARQVQREWLDELPADDPRAVRSRRDLVRVNTWMMQPGIMARALLAHYGPGAARHSRSRLGRWHVHAACGGFAGAAVAQCLRDHAGSAGYREPGDAPRVRCARLELQHDHGRFVRRFGGGPASRTPISSPPICSCTTSPARNCAAFAVRLAPLAPLFVACEPRRGALPLLGSRLLWVIGCNDVTRHDAVLSVEAGFNGRELSALWPEPNRWQLHEHAARLFTHCFVARRIRESAQHAI